jgi:hypothetical protein
MSITIKPSLSANEYNSAAQLTKYTKYHINDVSDGMNFIADKLIVAGKKHDYTKLENPDEFFKALKSDDDDADFFKMHYSTERHHLNDNIPDDVNLIDVIEFIVDGCMAGLARSGEYEYQGVDQDMLLKAYKNTISLMLKETKVDNDILNTALG